ncbi:MAG TPA: TlpA family protein disulfide reductase [Gammaproteobacteria bacterium]|nr:TlpA family protein disulfide reductase [Gammaproteobacteria bacterium]
MLNRRPELLMLLLLVVLPVIAPPVFAAEPAPDFSLPTFPDDARVSLADFKGRVVYLDFWATWCPPCRKSFPWMDEMHERYKDQGLTIVAVSVDKKRELIERFIKKMEPSFIIAHDPTGKAAKDYNLRAMPSSYLIDRQGRLISVHMGFRNKDREKMEEAIESLLDE